MARKEQSKQDIRNEIETDLSDDRMQKLEERTGIVWRLERQANRRYSIHYEGFFGEEFAVRNLTFDQAQETVAAIESALSAAEQKWQKALGME